MFAAEEQQPELARAATSTPDHPEVGELAAVRKSIESRSSSLQEVASQAESRAPAWLLSPASRAYVSERGTGLATRSR